MSALEKDEPPMTSTRPYLLRAMNEWIVDNGLTPYLVVDATIDRVEVPREYVENGKIVLNIMPSAVHNLVLDNDWISFSARFSGRPFSVLIPVIAVSAIYARENGKGMFFQPEESDTLPPPEPPKKAKPFLKRIK